MAIRVMSSNVWGWGKIANRDDLLAELYKEYLPDTIGLQEASPVLRGEVNDLFSLCKPEYSELEVNAAGVNFTPILYRNTLRVIECGRELFTGLNDVNSKSITYGVFEKDNKRFLHANVHFYWRNDFSGAEARITNAHQLLTLLDRFKHLPIILSGDFNCEQITFPIQMIENAGYFLTSRLNKVNVKSHHGYPFYDSEKGVFTGGTLEGGRYASIDHIFTRGCKPLAFTTVQNSLAASDHCPIFADMEI